MSVTYDREVTSAERFFTRSPYSVVTVIARIKGYVSEDLLQRAVAKVRRRHALLSVRIRDGEDHLQWFTSEQAGAIPIETVRRDSADDWVSVHMAALKTPFEFSVRPPLRFILVQSRDVSELIILCHHIICDGMSLAYLVRDLMDHLGDPAREAEVLPPQPPITLGNLPQDVSQPGIAKFLINRMNQKWAEEAVFFDNEDYRALAKAYWDAYSHEVLPIELSEAETSSLVARCRSEGVTVNSALTAAFAGAQSHVQVAAPYHAKIVVAANLRSRLPNHPGEGMGMYAGGVELKFRYDHRRSFWENARGFHRRIRPNLTNRRLFSDVLNWLYLDPTLLEAITFKKLGGLVPSDSPRYRKLSAFSRRSDIVLRMLRRDNLASLETKHWGTAVTNLGRLDFPREYGALELDRLILQPGGGIPLANVNMVLGAATCSGKLSLVVEYAPEAVSPDTMKAAADRAMWTLLNERELIP